MLPNCPHCGGSLGKDTDGYEHYLTCMSCAREYDENLYPRIMTPRMLWNRTGIQLTKFEQRAFERDEKRRMQE